MVLSFFAFLLLCICSSSTAAGDYYTAAVVEYNPITNYDPNITKEQAQAVMFSNLREYDVLIADAKEQGAQIIVFPEYGMFGADFETRNAIYPFLEEVPEPNSGIICKNDTFISSPVVQKLSCLAVSHDIVIVVNMGAYVPCTGVVGCPDDGRWQYNTDVVFSEEGVILTKYYKSHLYGEMGYYNQPLVADPKNFTTSFGVTFGILICFDIMFPYPQFYYEQTNITNMIFSTWWVNTPPYFSANQVQLAWSKVTGSNLLASGIGLNWYTSGSGIFSAGVPLEFYFNPTWNSTQRLLIHSLPSNPQKDNFHITEANVAGGKQLRDDVEIRRLAIQDIVGANVGVFLASHGAAGSLTVSEGNLTCTVTYQISSAASEDYYGLAVFNGNYNDLFYGQLCALLLCPSNTTCTAQIIEASTVFSQFNLEGNFSAEARLYSTVTTNNMYLAPVNSYETGPSYLRSSNYNLPLLSATIFGVVW